MTDTLPMAEEPATENEKGHRRRWLGHVADLAVIASVIVTAVIFHLQRKDAAESMRRSTTVDMVAVRYTDRLLSAEQHVNNYIIKNYNLYAQTELADNDEEKPTVELNDTTRADFMLLVDFYSDILACRQNNQCEPALVDQWFKEDICQFAKLGAIIGFPQLREQFGEQVFERLDAFKASDCKEAA